VSVYVSIPQEARDSFSRYEAINRDIGVCFSGSFTTVVKRDDVLRLLTESGKLGAAIKRALRAAKRESLNAL